MKAEDYRPQSFEQFLNAAGLYVVYEGQAVLDGRVFNVKACGHRNCRVDSHARLEAKP